jgi:hypothetical protein
LVVATHSDGILGSCVHVGSLGDLCDHVEQGETYEAWMNALKPHCREAHSDVMKNKTGTIDEIKREMEQWMADNKARFEAA